MRISSDAKAYAKNVMDKGRFREHFDSDSLEEAFAAAFQAGVAYTAARARSLERLARPKPVPLPKPCDEEATGGGQLPGLVIGPPERGR